MKAKKLLPWIVGVLGAILLSALGSGVWSGILSPLLRWFIDITIRFLSSISVTFKNDIYVEAAKGFHENTSLTLCTVVFIVLIVAYCWIINHFIPTGTTRKSFSTIQVKKSTFVYVHIFALVAIFLTYITFNKVSYANRLTTQSLNSVDIIAPFIEQKEYLSLKSDFLRIKNAEDYEAFHRKMVELSAKHEIELPLFKPL